MKIKKKKDKGVRGDTNAICLWCKFRLNKSCYLRLLSPTGFAATAMH